ncbi:MAG: hypothetical protein JNK34_10555, partial [Tabrizicola sp.]|nr:hypothetical protein [Tabrizicola sp.]
MAVAPNDTPGETRQDNWPRRKTVVQTGKATGGPPDFPLKSLLWPMRLTLAGLWAERLA